MSFVKLMKQLNEISCCTCNIFILFGMYFVEWKKIFIHMVFSGGVTMEKYKKNVILSVCSVFLLVLYIFISAWLL
jgi:hypothetical protein